MKLLFPGVKETRLLLKVIKDVSLEETPFIIKNHYMAPLGNCHSVISGLTDNSDLFNKSERQPLADDSKSSSIKLIEESRQVLKNAKLQAAQLIAEANKKAGMIIKTAEDEGFQKGVENGRQQGYDDGYRQGSIQAKSEIEKQLADVISSTHNEVEKMKNSAQIEARRIISSAEPQIVQISFSIAEKILERELDRDSEVIIPIVKSAVAKVLNQEDIIVRVHPQHYDKILQIKDDLQSIAGYECTISIIPDTSLTVGDCLIDTTNGVVDAKMSTRLANLRSSLLDFIS